MRTLVEVLTVACLSSFGAVLGAWFSRLSRRSESVRDDYWISFSENLPPWLFVAGVLIASQLAVLLYENTYRKDDNPLFTLGYYFLLSCASGFALATVIEGVRYKLLRSPLWLFLLCAVIMSISVTTVVLHLQDSPVSFTSQFQASHLVVLGSLEAIIGALALFWLRLQVLFIYASLEIIVGLTGSFVSFQNMSLDRVELAQVLGLASAIYCSASQLSDNIAIRTSL